MTIQPGFIPDGFIPNKLKALEIELQEARSELVEATGPEALQIRAHIVVLERSRRYWQGRSSPYPKGVPSTTPITRKRARANARALGDALQGNTETTVIPRPKRQTGRRAPVKDRVYLYPEDIHG